MRGMPAKPRKCPCNCGQAPAETTRLRKARCAWCGYIIRLSRDCISRGLPTCPCGGTLEPECLYDASAAPGEIGAAAYSELCARDTDSAVRSDNHKRRAIGQHRCPDCSAFRPFGANCGPTAKPDPCPRCGSTAPARFNPRRVASVATPVLPF